jgi:hypothetical protein
MFFISTRRGISWFAVKIAGFGNRASSETRGGGPEDVGDVGILVELFLSKRPGFFPAAALGAFSRN